MGPAGYSREQAVARGDGALRVLREDYRQKLHHDIDGLAAAVAAGSSDGVLAYALEIKGFAATFGYELVDRISASLCRYIQAGSSSGRHRQMVFQAHLEGLRCIVAQDVQGQGDEQQEALVAALVQLTSTGRAT